MGKFSVGQRFRMTDWFTGGTMGYEVTEIDGTKITFSVIDNEPDGVWTRQETYEITKDETCEKAVIFEYSGHECAIYADNAY